MLALLAIICFLAASAASYILVFNGILPARRNKNFNKAFRKRK